MEIIEARGEDQIAAVRALFEEYWQSFGFTPCFQGFAEELAGLPGDYVSIALLIDGDRFAGCAALRPFDAERAEFKRLYVRPQYRGLNLGHRLMEWIIDRARALGYRELVADTMPQMQTALAMYLRAGFEQTGPYAEDPTPGAIYLRRRLGPTS